MRPSNGYYGVWMKLIKLLFCQVELLEDFGEHFDYVAFVQVISEAKIIELLKVLYQLGFAVPFDFLAWVPR